MARYAPLDRIFRGIPEFTLVQLTNDDPLATAVDEAVLAQVVGDVEDLVDDYLRGRYPLPLQQVPTSLGRIVVQLARHDVYARRPESKIPEDVVRMYKGAMQMLEAIRDGSISLGDDSQAAQPEPGVFKVRGPGRQITEGVLYAYRT